jgi:hypothetical protein
VLLCSALLFFACSKDSHGQDDDTETPTEEPKQLVLTLSSQTVSAGDEVTFSVTADGQIVEADIYIDNQKIAGDKHVFESSGDYEIVAKKGNYKESDKVLVAVYKVDIYVSGIQSINGNNTSDRQAIVWKNGEVFYELTDGTAFATTAGIAFHNDDMYVGGTEVKGLSRVAKYWKNNTPHILTDGVHSAVVDDVEVDQSGNVYVIGTDSNPHKPVLWRNGVAQSLSDASGNRYARAITTSGDDVYVAGNSSSYANTASIAILWKNGQEIHLTDGTKDARAYGAAVEDGNVYVMGDEKNTPRHEPGGYEVRKYWKNGGVTLLNEDPETIMVYTLSGGIAVQDGDVYITGSVADATSRSLRAAVWKNGKRLYELTSGDFNSGAVDVVVDGQNLYTVGYESNSKGRTAIKVWKNDELLYDLTDGTREAIPSGIVVKRSK